MAPLVEHPITQAGEAALPEHILEFWFGALPHAERREWFRKNPAFDAGIREHFGTTLALALAGGLGKWALQPRSALAHVLVLDQFTRNALRDTAGAFSGDALALATARHAVDAGFDRALDARERQFLYMPFEHSEDRAAQQRSLQLFEALARDTGLARPLDYARRHHAVVERFGRFPHRNAALGRPSTPEELAFLREPCSSF